MSPETIDQWVDEFMYYCWDTDDGQIRKMLTDKLTEAYNEGAAYERMMMSPDLKD